jgi:hypothetical protein
MCDGKGDPRVSGARPEEWVFDHRRGLSGDRLDEGIDELLPQMAVAVHLPQGSEVIRPPEPSPASYELH